MQNLLIAGALSLTISTAAAASCPAPKPLPTGSRRPEIVDSVMPGVVQVQATFASDGSESEASALGDAMRENEQGTKQSLGTGFVVSADGLVVTNAHVVAQANRINVRLADGSVRSATLLGSDPRTDIALLRLETSTRCYPSLVWGDSNRVRIGDDITAVGSPFGLGGSVTAGIISGRGRSLGNGPYDDFLQIDAAINPGNSGGPLLDSAGRVVGINTAILAPGGGNIGIGFSLPSALVQRVIAELLAAGKVRHGILGVEVQGLTGDSADALGLKSSAGVLVTQVEPSGPAGRAGLEPADVVLGIGGRPIADMGALAAEVAAIEAGSNVRLQVWRDGKPLAFDLVAAARPNAELRAKALAGDVDPGETVSLAGVQLAGTTGRLDAEAGANESVDGLIVVTVAPNSPAAARGIAVGDIIIGLGGKPLSSTVQLTQAIADARRQGKRNILVTLLHGKETTFMPLPIPTGD